MSPTLITTLGAGAVALAWWQYRVQRRLADERGRVFDECRTLFDPVSVTDVGCDYPRLSGRYRGERIELQPLLDHVGYRKLPSQWLSLTLYAPLPLGGTFDVLIRPQNIEFWSASQRLEQRIHLPEGWPAHHIARVSPHGWQPPLARLRQAAGPLLQAPEFKELLVSRRGVRIVYRLGGVQRAHYMVLRSLLPECARIDAAVLQPVLDALVGIADALRSEAALERVA